MYYNRTISSDFASLLETGGKLRWLFDFVKSRKDLDFLISKNASGECISVYRGRSRVLKIKKTKDSKKIKIDGDKAYKNINPGLYGDKSININFEKELISLIDKIKDDEKLNGYYKKEGYYQNEISRKYGILSNPNTDFVIIDKEVVIGYCNTQTRKQIFHNGIRKKYQTLLKKISRDYPRRYNKNATIGNKPDFLALDKKGNLLLIEVKYYDNAAGIYLSPLQIGTYYEIFSRFRKETKTFEKSIFAMLEQKQKIGLVNPKWKEPNRIKDIIPVLVVAEYNYDARKKSSNYDVIGKFNEILELARDEFGSGFLSNIKTYNYTKKEGLKDWI